VVKSKDGRMHPNVQRAMAADKMPPMKAKPMAGPPKMGGGAPEAPAMETEGDGGHTTLHDHGDGTFHTETHDGQRTEHPHIGHALMHMHGLHSDGAKGMHVHQEHHGGFTTHHHGGSGGGVEGGHDHANLEALKGHMDKFLGEEEQEGQGGIEGEGAGEGAY
jgi:hypothetical protein